MLDKYILYSGIITMKERCAFMGIDLKKCEFEIGNIIQDFDEIQCGNIYENGYVRGTPSVKTYAKNINERFIGLLDKMVNDKSGDLKTIRDAMNKSF